MTQIRLVVVGNTLLTKKALDALSHLSYEVKGVIQTSDDSTDLIAFCDLALYCLNKGIHYKKFDNLQSAKVTTYLKSFEFDAILFVGYSGTISQDIVNIPPVGCIATYEGLLPQYAGHDPVCHTVLDEIPVSGLTLYKVSRRHPFGNIILQREIDVAPRDDAGDVFNNICDLFDTMLEDLRLEITLGFPSQAVFDDRKIVKFWRQLKAEDCRITDWNVPCKDLVKKIRSIAYPYAGAWFTRANRKIIAWRAREGRYKTEKPPGSVIYYDNEHYVVTTATNDLDITSYDITNR